MTPSSLRSLALALPGTTEQPHFDLTSFRVGTKIVATMPPGEAVVHVFVAEEDARAAVDEAPGAVELLWWGKRLSGVRVVLDAVTPDGERLVAELLADAWRRKASRRLVAQHDADLQ